MTRRRRARRTSNTRSGDDRGYGRGTTNTRSGNRARSGKRSGSRRDPRGGGPTHSDSSTVLDLFSTELDALWARGWMPAELVRVMCGGNSTPRPLLIGLVLHHHRLRDLAVHPRWRAQLDDLSAEPHLTGESLRSALPPTSRVADSGSLLLRMRLLGPLMFTCPPPGSAGARASHPTGVGDRYLEKVRALLAKAEATEFPSEAEIFSAKAHDLMVRHAIDEVMLEGGRPDGAPEGLRVWIDSPHAIPKFNLLAATAEGHGCRALWNKGLSYASLIGYRSDLDAVEMLFTSLLVQVTGAALAHGSVVDEFGRSRTASFRRAFILGFAERIGRRFIENRQRAAAEATDTHGSSVLPVLAAREDEVERAVDEAFPLTTTMRTSSSNLAGYSAGYRAGARADLGGRRMGRGRDTALGPGS